MTLINLDLNAGFIKALQALEKTSDNLFLTGKAGTGKSTLLTLFRQQTQKKVVVLAPTGVAALNVQGETIHSFFKFKANVTLEDAIKNAQGRKRTLLFKNLDTIIIDEISMVRADLLDCMDQFLKTVLNNQLPFGGKQVVFIGDLYQLSPVVTPTERAYFQEVYDSPYFFSAEIMKDSQWDMTHISLEKIYRQEDPVFIDILNAVRTRTVTDNHLNHLNQRISIPYHPNTIYLTTTNADADAINAQKLRQLDTFSVDFSATVSGKFDLKWAPTEQTLTLKTGAQVMFLNNESNGNWVNGSIGEITSINKKENTLLVQLQDGRRVTVKPHKWDLNTYVYNDESRTLIQESLGEFTQFPLKLAWAITIHKSQGKTFDFVHIDLGRGAFASGQVYVALSRCRTLEGITLRHRIDASQMKVDQRVVEFLEGLERTHPALQGTPPRRGWGS
jgi:ATP-dependent DNA helicase PIF1